MAVVRAGRPIPSDRVSETRVRVIYGDVDQMGVAYYANYFRWFEAGRGGYIRTCGASYAEIERRFEIFMPVAEAHARYRAPARYDEELVVATRISQLGWASCRFEYEIRREGGELIAEGYTVHACVDPSGRVRRSPPEVITFLGGRLPGPPARGGT